METITELERRIALLEEKVNRLSSHEYNDGWMEYGVCQPHYFNYWGTLCLANSTDVQIEYKIDSGRIMYRATLKGKRSMLEVDIMEGTANSGWATYNFTHLLRGECDYRFKLPLTLDELSVSV